MCLCPLTHVKIYFLFTLFYAFEFLFPSIMSESVRYIHLYLSLILYSIIIFTSACDKNEAMSSSFCDKNDDSFDDFDDGLSDHGDDFSAEVDEAINNPIELRLDFYAREDLDACRDNEYLNTVSSS